VNELDEGAEYELNPEDPGQTEKFLDEAADYGSNYRSTYGRKDQEGDGVFLLIGLPHVCENTESNGAACGGETAEETAYYICFVILCKGAFFAELVNLTAFLTTFD